MKLSLEIIILIIFSILILYVSCSCSSDTVTEGFATNIADADISAIRNLNSIANTLMQPNGTLTNPGNLNVTGSVALSDNVSVTNNTNEGGRVRILNSKKAGPNQTIDWSIWNMTGGYGDKLSFWRYNGNGVNAGPAMDIFDNGNVNIGGNLTTGGNITSSAVTAASSVVTGNINVGSLWNKRNNYLYYPEDAVIHQNLFSVYNQGVFTKSGNPSGWNDTTHPNSNPWPDATGHSMIRIGGYNTFPNGINVTVPAGKNLIWLRSLNERWTTFTIYTTGGASLGTFCNGKRHNNQYGPDGGGIEKNYNHHCWFSMPVPGPGNYIICCGGTANPGAGPDGWISGIGFSSNPWNHAYNSALAYHWIMNGGTSITWNNDNWNGDVLAHMSPGVHTLVVPVVPSGVDKLFYIIEHNNSWNGIAHNSITVNGTPIERFRTTWDHPLARHYNSKLYNRFIAARIPAGLTTGKNFLNIVVDNTGSSSSIHIREAGTIDMY